MSASSSGARHDPSAQLAIAPPWQVREDLHLHTNASDGVLNLRPELVELVNATSLTIVRDHRPRHDIRPWMKQKLRASNIPESPSSQGSN